MIATLHLQKVVKCCNAPLNYGQIILLMILFMFYFNLNILVMGKNCNFRKEA